MSSLKRKISFVTVRDDILKQRIERSEDIKACEAGATNETEVKLPHFTSKIVNSLEVADLLYATTMSDLPSLTNEEKKIKLELIRKTLLDIHVNEEHLRLSEFIDDAMSRLLKNDRFIVKLLTDKNIILLRDHKETELLNTYINELDASIYYQLLSYTVEALLKQNIMLRKSDNYMEDGSWALIFY